MRRVSSGMRRVVDHGQVEWGGDEERKVISGQSYLVTFIACSNSTEVLMTPAIIIVCKTTTKHRATMSPQHAAAESRSQRALPLPDSA